MKKYEQFIEVDKEYTPIGEVVLRSLLKPGVYEVLINMNTEEVYFNNINTNHDKLIDLPNTEYDTVVTEIEKFMTPATRKRFDENGFIYKRSTLLYGAPGTGKTCIVNRIIHKVVNDDGIVLFSPNPALLHEAFTILESIQPETRVMVVFEELDQLIKNHEKTLLNILDGEIQKNNVIYMATTNYIEKIPTRIRRPGRFSSTVEVGFPTAATRDYYLKLKLGENFNTTEWVEKTEGFSIDELKETVLAVVCLDYDLDNIIKRIRENKGQVHEKVEDKNYIISSVGLINPF